ncbi:MAG: hypothetical protein ABIO49_07560 [Dokdonella sp.]
MFACIRTKYVDAACCENRLGTDEIAADLGTFHDDVASIMSPESDRIGMRKDLGTFGKMQDVDIKWQRPQGLKKQHLVVARLLPAALPPERSAKIIAN